ncbi:endonuclease, partial [Fulvivirga aurantia]|uniref:endonuclease n=1 Tax=Fulvivirga aurantia TaxID=2529383 RepID=UPI001CA390D1
MKKRILFSILLLVSLHSFSQVPAGYYDPATGLTGEELKMALHKIINNHTVKTYSEVKDALRATDEDPANPDNVILIYTGRSIDKFDFASDPTNPSNDDFWNREHVWSKSHGFPDDADTAYTDIHHLRPCDQTVNSSRSNKDFSELPHTAEYEEGEAPNTYTNDDYWEPRDEVKGDVARMMFYMATRYNSDALDLELRDHITFSGQPLFGRLYKLIKWHENDPVDQFERDRNDKIAEWQNNRNPFIDHPEFVGEIWGTTAEPQILIDTVGFSTGFGEVAAGDQQVQSYKVNGYNLDGDVTVSATAPFELSTDGSTWSSSITLSNNVSEAEQEFEVFVKLSPSVADGSTFVVDITHTSLNTPDVIFDVTGKEGEVLLTIEDARKKPMDERVIVTGIVIGGVNNSNSNRVIYDGTAGIVVRGFGAANESSQLEIGDSVKVKGGIGQYNNLLQISGEPVYINVLKQNVEIPTAQNLEIDQINEDAESELVIINNVWFNTTGQFQGGGSEGNYTITDGENTFIFRLGSDTHPLVGADIPTGIVNITGYIGQFGSDYQISPRYMEDVTNQSIISIAEAREKPIGSPVYVSGVVVDAQNNSVDNRIVYDGTAFIELRSQSSDSKSSDLVQGDSIVVFGSINEYLGQLQISSEPIKLTTISNVDVDLNAEEVEITELGEAFESHLVTVSDLTFTSTGVFEAGVEYSLTDGTNEAYFEVGLEIHPLSGKEIPSSTVSVTGFLKQSGDDYIIMPRSDDDLKVSAVTSLADVYSDRGDEVTFYPNPTRGVIKIAGFNKSKKIAVYNLFGELVFKAKASDQIDISSLST